MEAETRFTRFVQRRPIVACGFQQGVSADYVGLDEIGRTGNGAIHMGLGCQMHDGVRLMLAQHPIHLLTVTDIDTFERVTRVLADFGQRLEVTGVSQLVDVNNRVGGVGDDMANDCRADKPGTAGY
ncbi:hypothetical protein D3C86_1451370 [compost metagenome]